MERRDYVQLAQDFITQADGSTAEVLTLRRTSTADDGATTAVFLTMTGVLPPDEVAAMPVDGGATLPTDGATTGVVDGGGVPANLIFPDMAVNTTEAGALALHASLVAQFSGTA